MYALCSRGRTFQVQDILSCHIKPEYQQLSLPISHLPSCQGMHTAILAAQDAHKMYGVT